MEMKKLISYYSYITEKKRSSFLKIYSLHTSFEMKLYSITDMTYLHEKIVYYSTEKYIYSYY